MDHANDSPMDGDHARLTGVFQQRHNSQFSDSHRPIRKSIFGNAFPSSQLSNPGNSSGKRTSLFPQSRTSTSRNDFHSQSSENSLQAPSAALKNPTMFNTNNFAQRPQASFSVGRSSAPFSIKQESPIRPQIRLRSESVISQPSTTDHSPLALTHNPSAHTHIDSDPLSSPSANDSRDTLVESSFEKHRDALVDDTDFTELMHRKMKEGQVLRGRLAEERAATAAVKAQVVSLEERLASSQIKASSAESALSDAQTKLHECQSTLATTENQLSLTQQTLTALEQSHVETSSQLEKMHTTLSEKDSATRIALSEAEAAKRIRKECEDRLDRLRGTVRSKLDELATCYDSMKNSISSLKNKSEHNLFPAVTHARDEVDSLKTSLDAANIGLRHALHERDAKSAELRVAVDELRGEKRDAEAVIDLLRNKLTSVYGELAHAREIDKERGQELSGLVERVETLMRKRDEEEAKLQTEKHSLVAQLESETHKVKALIANLDRLRHFEQEAHTLDTRVKLLEENLKASQEAAARILEHDTSAFETRILTLEEKLTTSNDNSKQTSTKLEQCEASLSATRSQLDALQVEHMAQAEVKVKAILAVDKFKAESATSAAALTALADEKVALRQQVNSLEIALGKERQTTAELSKIVEQLRPNTILLQDVQMKLAVAQDRFDNQTMILKLNKELSGDLQDKLLTAEASHAANIAVLLDQKASLEKAKTIVEEELRAIRAQLTVLPVLQEQKAALERVVQGLNKDITELSTSSTKMSSEIAVLLQKNQTTQGKLAEVQEQCKDAENRNLKLKSDLEHAVNQHQSVQATVVQMHEENQDLRMQMHKDCKALEDALATADVEHEQRLADQKALYAKLVSSLEERAVKADENAKEQKLMFMGMRSQLDDMKREIATVTRPSANSADVDILQSEWEAKVDALERSLLAKESEIETLDSNAKTLQQRYKDGKLNECEKTFVCSVLQMSQVIYEQDVVAKENELRRRDNMITTLQAKIQRLESTLAKCLKEKGKGGETKSMIDLGLWMSSSPMTEIVEETDKTPKAGSSKLFTVATPSNFVTPVQQQRSDNQWSMHAPANVPKPVAISPQRTTLTKIAQDDDTSDIESADELPEDRPPRPSLGKRTRGLESVPETASQRPVRRSKAVAAARIDISKLEEREFEKPTKSKSVRRRRV